GGPGKRLGKKDGVWVSVAHFPQHPLPERQWLSVRIIDTKNAHTLLDPENHNVTQGAPQCSLTGCTGQRAIEIRVDDVLVALGRVLCVLQRAVRPPIEPVGMLPQPRMVRRALNSKVQSD